eukprot:TRINITY_DN23800_c0_g1_i1.p1 TRINITY_DN23800_c0_g1~~TRINITY_DN23800_c0_g1_i1.p1  ORF type:complete len:695 (-),score=190.33 TRINITY_DN23800_c0_g1_i1:61-2145(-)
MTAADEYQAETTFDYTQEHEQEQEEQAIDSAEASAAETSAAEEFSAGFSRPVKATKTGKQTWRLVKASFALTVKDVESGAAANAEGDHSRSQDIFQRVLRHAGIVVEASSMAEFTKPVPAGTNVHEAELPVRRNDFTKKIFRRIRKANGVYGIRTLRLMLHSMDLNNDGLLNFRSVEGALLQNGVRLLEWELHHLQELFSREKRQEWYIDYCLFLACGYKSWSKKREEAVVEAFDVLSKKCPANILTMQALMRNFHPEVLTADVYPDLDEHAEGASMSAFMRHWSQGIENTDGTITLEEFKYHYLDVSAGFTSEWEFLDFTCRSWGIDPDDWLAKTVFRQFAPPGGEGEEDILGTEDFKRMLHAIFNNIDEDEIDAWYGVMDEDRSGEVSLQEFIDRKILKAKRLYDDHVKGVDENGSKAATKDELVLIIQSLSPKISTAEACVLYHYADLDGNGTISFTEFLENQLLKLLQVYEQVNKGSTRKTFSEEELGLVMKQMDPGLDKDEVHAIFKAVDTDGGGSVSFVEFCQSQVLRAKTLFDRYDIDRSRALTEHKFVEMLRFFDSTWTEDEEKAICNLVINPQTGKVTLSSFLNTNIIKLKLLFDKYDRDRGRSLDRNEFKVMLKELFTSDDKDVQELINALYPQEDDSDEGITFLQYVRNFKELNRRNDALVLAKRRKAREKAKRMGLVFNYQD